MAEVEEALMKARRMKVRDLCELIPLMSAKPTFPHSGRPFKAYKPYHQGCLDSIVIGDTRPGSTTRHRKRQNNPVSVNIQAEAQSQT
ncbi:hypothetical protein TNCT_63281 [Trichonephila clavata]|uniref:Uncharacterized protein n=1 Tax=Trichonephila clavata TaxID=2740835 RepID=A0A8X6FCS8_TRICU|nr:hypothetical protein TNCT_63281 [Trichonephila clavata]